MRVAKWTGCWAISKTKIEEKIEQESQGRDVGKAYRRKKKPLSLKR